MSDQTKRPSRRDVLKAVAMGATALGVGVTNLGCNKKQTDGAATAIESKRKTLRIAKPSRDVPALEKWFKEKFCKEWGERNDTDVIIDYVDSAAVRSIAAAEVSSKKGHDLLGSLWPMPANENDVIDHSEIYEECARRYGRATDLAVKSTQNPKTNKYFAFATSFAPEPVHYRRDLFDQAGGKPDTWDDIRRLGKKIKDKTGIGVGVGLSTAADTAMALRAVMYSFGASEQSVEGNMVLDSKQTLEAVKFVRALYREAMAPGVLSWDVTSNNRAILTGKATVAFNAIAITRAAEKEGIPSSENVWLARAPKGTTGRLGPAHVVSAYSIWKFAENIDGAKTFLADYAGVAREAFVQSEFYDLPCFPTVPDLARLVTTDAAAKPEDKHALLADATKWVTNIGYPGHTNAAIDDGYVTRALNAMFAQAATGAMSPQEAIHEATGKYEELWAKWKERKLL